MPPKRTSKPYDHSNYYPYQQYSPDAAAYYYPNYPTASGADPTYYHNLTTPQYSAGEQTGAGYPYVPAGIATTSTTSPVLIGPVLPSVAPTTLASTKDNTGASTANTTITRSTADTVPSQVKNYNKKRKFTRAAGGEVWDDSTLAEWDPNDFRLFAGDLGNEVTDDLLTRTFSTYPSFVKAKVIRDKKTGKSRGYGFISFKDPADFSRAWRDWNGKYVGNRPIKLRKSNWRDRNLEVKRRKEGDIIQLPPRLKR
ncbi:hypothetical protein IWQ61_004176 [Dispira simplex]|nr:hypothetical protein IWQ61_004176 [Dispira simplex]